MRSYPAPSIPEPTMQALQRFVSEGATQNELIQRMRDEGLSVVPSIRLLSRFFKVSVSEAKMLVHYSETWADCLASHEALHDAAEAAMERSDAEKTTTPSALVAG